VLITVCEKLINLSEDEKPTLSFIHDYLESRLALLRTVAVSDSLFSALLHINSNRFAKGKYILGY